MAVMVVAFEICAKGRCRMVRTVRAAAARRSGRTRGRARRDRRGNSRRSSYFSSQPFADVGVTNACRKEAEPEGQHGDVKHEMFLCIGSAAAADTAFRIVRVRPQVPPGA